VFGRAAARAIESVRERGLEVLEPGLVSAVEDVTLFTAVDRTQDPGFFARFLDEGLDGLVGPRASAMLLPDALAG